MSLPILPPSSLRPPPQYQLSPPCSDSPYLHAQHQPIFRQNDCLSFSTSAPLRARILAEMNASPVILSSGGARFLAYTHAPVVFEARLGRVFRSPAALLFN